MLVLVLLLYVPSVLSFPNFARLFPNGFVVPMRDGGYCKAAGHPGCSPYQDSSTTQFAEDFDDNGFVWGLDFCKLDSDGDGLTNADELGDPCCLWRANSDGGFSTYTPQRTIPFLSNPDDPLSTISAPSCFLNGPPSSAPAIVVAKGYSNGFTVSLTPPINSCVCTYRVSAVAFAATSPTTAPKASFLGPFSFDGTTTGNIDLNVCFNAPSGVLNYTVYLYAANLANGSSPASIISLSSLSPETISSCSIALAAATIPPNQDGDEITMVPLSGLLPCLLIIVTLVFGIIFRFSRHTAITKVFVHGHIFPDIQGWKGMWLLDEISEINIGEALLWGGYAAMCGVLWVYYCDQYQQQIGQLPRAWGEIAYAHLVLVLLPVSRNSIWHAVIGIPFERAVRIHRWMGKLLLVWCALHGFGMAVCYNQLPGAGSRPGNSGLTIISTWGPSAPSSPLLNNLAGLLAFVFWGAIAVTSINIIRRKIWEFFYAFHLVLFLLSVIMVCLHVSDAAYHIAIGLAIYGIDVVLRILRLFTTKTKLLSVNILGKDIVELKIICTEKFPLLSRFQPGQWVMLTIPKISLVPHPFTVSYKKTLEDRQVELHFHIKSMGPTTFTGALLNIVNVKTNPFPTIFVEGPYGSTSVVPEEHERVLMFAGGIGITPIVNIFTALAANKKANQKIVTKNVKLIWSLRDHALLDSLRSQLEHACMVPDCTIQVQVFMSVRAHLPAPADAAPAPPDGPKSPQESIELLAPNDTRPSAFVKVHGGRPDISKIIEEEMQEAIKEDGKVAVLACGPAAMMADIHNNCIAKGPRVVFHRETFEF